MPGQLSFDQFYTYGKMNHSEPDVDTKTKWLSINPIMELMKAAQIIQRGY